MKKIIKIYFTLDNENYVYEYSSSKINDNNIELELDKNHAFFNSDCRCWKYKNGELIFDKEKQLKLIDEFKNIEEKPTTQERIEALENALLELILRGDDDD